MLFPQTGNWRAGMQDVSAAIDDAMGELVTVTPAHFDKVNFPSVSDPSRSATVVAVFTSKAESVIMGGGKAGAHSAGTLISTSKPIFTFGYGVLPFPLQQSHRITRLCSGVMYEVTDVKPDGVSRIVADVVQLGRQRESR